MAMTGDPDLEKAWEQVDRLNQDPETRALAYHRETALLLYQSDLATAQRRGEAEGKAEGVLDVLSARGLPVSEAQRARVLGCTDVAILGRWLRRAVTAATAEEVFAD